MILRFSARLSEEAKKSNTLINMRGTISGSILCYLLEIIHSILFQHIIIVPNVDIMKKLIRIYLALIFHPENVLVVIQKCGQTDIICLWKPSGE